MPGTSLIIPTYNRASRLSQTLSSLQRLEVPNGWSIEILVIDNNCTDQTTAVVTQAALTLPFPVKQFIETQQGLCFGRNRGLAEAQFEHLAFLDDDVLVAPRWLIAYREALDTFGVDAVVGPVIPHFEQPPPAYLYGRALQLIDSWYSRKGNTPRPLPLPEAHELPGCNFGVTRRMALQLQGFQTHLDRAGAGLLAGGDTDFGHRLVAAQGTTAYHPECWVEHLLDQGKFSKAYLRKRAFGLGATARRMNASPRPLWKRIRATLGAARLWAGVLWSQWTRHPEAFNRELIAQQACGQLWG